VARKFRIEFPGACYHLINRGNYRSWIFESAGDRSSFLECLGTVCESKGWKVHAWCLMSNHYHLLVETVEPNLVEGMAWLQSTFSNRFNRFRNENGHVFQGRYKALLLDADARVGVCHYIHLNPVRAGLVAANELERFEASSFHQLMHPLKRWGYGVYDTCLALPNALTDNPDGRLQYRQYLEWLSGNEREKEQLGFETMTRGWAKGSKEFRKELLSQLPSAKLETTKEADGLELKETVRERGIEHALQVLGKDETTLQSTPKGAVWKIGIALYMRERYLAPNAWIAKRLHMGAESSVQSWVSRHRREPTSDAKQVLEMLKNHGTLD
jgi:putative transposase